MNKEYWLIDLDRQQAEFYRLGDTGRYHLVPLETGGIFRSQVIAGFWLRVERLWQLPEEIAILRAIDGHFGAILFEGLASRLTRARRTSLGSATKGR
jgi:hypothetical protein